MKQCLWCKEDIKPTAKKCIHCGTFQPPHFYYFDVILFVIPIIAVVVSMYQARSSLEGAAEAAEALREIKAIEKSLAWNEVKAHDLKTQGFDLACDYKMKAYRKDGVEDVFFPINKSHNIGSDAGTSLRFLMDHKSSFVVEISETDNKFVFDLKEIDHYEQTLKGTDSLHLHKRCPSPANYKE